MIAKPTYKRVLMFSILLLLSTCGCAARKVHDDRIGAPPFSEGGEWKCGNNHYKYRPWTGKCEREP
jgi:hypothetical protein